jgi:GT2 family glycosyltransferase
MSTYEPVEVVHLDLADGRQRPAAGRRMWIAVWHGDLSLGHLELGPDAVSEPWFARALAGAILESVGSRLFPDGYAVAAPSALPPPVPPAPPLDALLANVAPLAAAARTGAASASGTERASVIVCTRGRPDDLGRCLEAIAAVPSPPGEVIVVDNDPADGRTRAVVERAREATYVAEPRPGLSVARNTGIRAARGDVIAFVDDDTVVHERWLEALLAGFDGPRVLAVTGGVLPAELRTRAQVVFERRMGQAARGHARIAYGREFFEPQKRDGVPVWRIGAGANMAFRREAFDRVGLFDERLGAGAAGCSEDSELWYRLLAAGWECRYEPDSVVLHHHRAGMDELRRQAHDYMQGHVAALWVQWANHRHPGNLRRIAVSLPAHLLLGAVTERFEPPEARAGLLGREVRGYLAGLRRWPLALRGRR